MPQHDLGFRQRAGRRGEDLELHLSERRLRRVGVRRRGSGAAAGRLHIGFHAIQLTVAELRDGSDIGIGVDANAGGNRSHAGVDPDAEGSGDRGGISSITSVRRRSERWSRSGITTRIEIGTIAASSARRGASSNTSPDPSRIGRPLKMSSRTLFQVSSDGCVDAASSANATVGAPAAAPSSARERQSSRRSTWPGLPNESAVHRERIATPAGYPFTPIPVR